VDIKGRFVWYELLTSDPEAAKRFYGAVVGWKAEAWNGNSAPYSILKADETPVGGVMKLLPEFEYTGKTPHWWAHVGVANVDAAARRAAELGGRILKPGTDIPEVGRFAIVADPQGALISVFEPGGDPMPPPDPMRTGCVSWHELHTTDQKSALRFYSAMFGWKPANALDVGEMGTYQMFRHAEAPENAPMGGMFDSAKAMNAAPHWLYYVNVQAMDPALGRVRQAGGRVLNGPMDVPGGGRAAQCRDPQGADFALFSMK
jgi:predicted enzyme related to lactoylglutathione lyase